MGSIHADQVGTTSVDAYLEYMVHSLDSVSDSYNWVEYELLVVLARSFIVLILLFIMILYTYTFLQLAQAVKIILILLFSFLIRMSVSKMTTLY